MVDIFFTPHSDVILIYSSNRSIQTFGHMEQVLQWPQYAILGEHRDVLRPDMEKVYEMIDKMLRTVTSAVRSKRIHVGMDEVKQLGRVSCGYNLIRVSAATHNFPN